MQVQFLGGTGTVTGSKYLVHAAGARVLVDCGLFQGHKQLRQRNWTPLPVAARDIDAVLLTHAHLDHSGYLPLLVREGFRGHIYCSEATYDLCKLLLPDSGHLQEEDAAFANRHGFSKHAPALPLYTQQDAQQALQYFSPVSFDRPVALGAALQATLSAAGHILGAASVAISDGCVTTVFSGDLGRSDDLILVPPTPLERADYVVVESTYGNRRHDRSDPMQLLGQAIRDTAARGGVVVIPAFAIGRVQSLLYYLHLLKDAQAIPATLPIYLDSPMAIDATAVYHKHRAQHRLAPAQCYAMCHTARIINSVEESKQLDLKRLPMVIISASGMATGGRVLHHLKAFAPDPRNTILFAGFQAAGTRGGAIVAGASSVKIHGEQIPVRAQIVHIDGLSAHADGDDILAWLSHCATPPRNTFITHGEPDAAAALCQRIQSELHWPSSVPGYLDIVDL